MKSRSRQNSTKGLMIFFIKYHPPPPCFLPRNITKNAQTRPPPMRDVIIEQPLSNKTYSEPEPIWFSALKSTPCYKGLKLFPANMYLFKVTIETVKKTTK